MSFNFFRGEWPEFPRTIANEDFSDFLDICLEHSDIFTLTDPLYRQQTMVQTDLWNALIPYCLGAVRTPKWFGYDYSCPEEEYGEVYSEIMVYAYRSTPSARELIRRFVPDIFFDHIYFASRQNLESLCFFKNGRIIVCSISHEFRLQVHSKDRSFINQLDRFGKWIEAADLSDEQSRLEHLIPGIDKLIDFSRLCRTENASDPKTS